MVSSTINLPVKPPKKPRATESTPNFLRAKDTSRPLPLGSVARGVGADVLIGLERRTGDRHVDGGVGSQSVKHPAS